MKWVRLWADMPTDPVWRTISRRSGEPLSLIIATFSFMMIIAGDNDGYITGFDDEDIAAALDAEIEQITKIKDAMQGKVLDGDYLTGWEKRQPKKEDENSTARSRKCREAKKLKNDEKQEVSNTATPCNAMQRHATPRNAPEADADVDTDIITSTTADARDKNFDGLDDEADSESTPPDQQPSNPEKPGTGFEFYPPDAVPPDDDGAYRGVTYSLSSKKLKEIKAQFPEKSEKSIMNALRSYDGNRQNKRLTADHKLDHLALSKWIANEREPPPAGARASPALTAGQQRADSNRQFLDNMKANFEEEKNDAINGTYTVTSG